MEKEKLVFVTQNQNKLSDARLLMPGFDITHVDFEVPEIQSLNPQEIIAYKIKYAYEEVGRPCFVMDASLNIDSLAGFPGPLIKWYFKSVGADKICQIASLFTEMGCSWTTVLGYFNGEEFTYLDETVKGSLPENPRGTNGYDWDVIFVPEGEERTLAEMTFDEKQQYAVTKKLLGRFENFLKEK